MTEQIAHAVLRRMASPPPPAPDDVPITSSKAVRLAITRAADKTHAMAVSVSSLQEEVVGLDDLLASFDPAMMLLAMVSDGRVQGIAAVGLELRGALLELQTIGRVLDSEAEDRKATETDARLSEPLINAFLGHLQITAAQTLLDTWGDGFAVGERLTSARAAGLILDDVRYRMIRVSLDLGVGDRMSELAIALPSRSKFVTKAVEPAETADWETQFQAVVNGSPAILDALLHSFKMPLFRAENLAVGQVIPLPGCTVSSIKLLAGDGRRVATARLGQSGGMRAVRIEAAPHLQMEDMDQLGSAREMGQLPDAGMMGTFAADDVAQPDAPTIDLAAIEPAPVAPLEEVAMDAAPAAMSWDDEDLEAEPAAPLSWDDEDLEATSAEDAQPLDWSNEDFEPPQG